MNFKYYEIRACVEFDGTTHSYLGALDYSETIGDEVHTPGGAFAEATAAGQCRNRWRRGSL